MDIEIEKSFLAVVLAFLAASTTASAGWFNNNEYVFRSNHPDEYYKSWLTETESVCETIQDMIKSAYGGVYWTSCADADVDVGG